MNCSKILSNATAILKKEFIRNPSLDSEIILSNILKINRDKLLLNLDKTIRNSEITKFNNLIDRRKKREPVAYILGHKNFWKSRKVCDFPNDSIVPKFLLMVKVDIIFKYCNKFNFLSV